MTLCACGCGQQTRIATKTDRAHGQAKGQPLTYVHGHAAVQSRAESRTLIVEGEECRTIPLSHGKEAIVNASDYELLSRWRWSAKRDRSTWYAHRIELSGKRRKYVGMHQLLIDLNAGQIPEHRNGNGLDNRRSNLRPATQQQNTCNRRKRVDSSSGYIGVRLAKRGRWRARIALNRKRIHVGYFASAEEAARAYDDAARRYHGEFAVLNFPKENERGNP